MNAAEKDRRPNILFIMSDDHAAHAIGAYGSRINRTPHLDRLAARGMRCDNVLCANSICAPSRATILAGTHSHINGVRTLSDRFDGRQDHVAKRLQAGGYQTAIIGKWHLGHGQEADPTGFDHWCVLPGQGKYWNPDFLTPDGKQTVEGYCTEIITGKCLDWLNARDRDKPFFLMCHHKAPHRKWEPSTKYQDLYEDEDIPEPDTFLDDHAHHSRAARNARMTMFDLDAKDLKQPVPEGLSRDEQRSWRYQRYIKDYLRCIASVDDSVGELIDHLDAEGILDDTIVIYTSDQGFFLGDHGWFDKRFMYEESLRMPFLISYPQAIQAGSVCDEIITNLDFAPTWLDYAGLEVPEAYQGHSARPVFEGDPPADWQQAMYYRYWMHKDGAHNVWAHYGVRTRDFKLIYYYADLLHASNDGANKAERDTGPEPPEWELFDLRKDPNEMLSVYDDPDYEEIVKNLTRRLYDLQAACGDEPYDHPTNGLDLVEGSWG